MLMLLISSPCFPSKLCGTDAIPLFLAADGSFTLEKFACVILFHGITIQDGCRESNKKPLNLSRPGSRTGERLNRPRESGLSCADCFEVDHLSGSLAFSAVVPLPTWTTGARRAGLRLVWLLPNLHKIGVIQRHQFFD